jgi:UDP-GlcNAc:undecaprenyl-phosphate GlcNAc-1-phosphate transferase
VAALVLAAAAVPLLRRLAWRVGLVDRPRDGAHKTHARPMPYGGGAAIWLATLVVCLPLLLWTKADAALARPALILLAAGTALFLLGLADDRRPLPPLPRFGVQLAVVAALVAASPLFRLPILAGHPWAAGLASVLWIAALTNAFNFLDNMDGLAAGVGVLALLVLAAVGWLAGQPQTALFCLVLAGAGLGFLVYNFPPASLFMGDAGGLFLGFGAGSASVLLAAQLGQAGASLPVRLAPLLALAVPVYDLVSVSLIRLRSGRPPWIGDRNHISHRLVALGLSRRNAVLVIYGGTAVSALPVLAAVYGHGHSAWLAWLAAIGGIGLLAALDRTARQRVARA